MWHADSLSPPPPGHPQGRPRHNGRGGDGERVGVRGSKGLQPTNDPARSPCAISRFRVETSPLVPPLTLALSPQAGRGDPVGASYDCRRPTPDCC